MNRLGECGIDKIGGLYSIVKLSRGELAKNRLLITSRKLSRTTIRVVLLVGIDSLPILLIVPMPTPVLLCIWWWEYPFSRRERTEECLAADMGLMVVVKDQEGKWTKFNMSNWYKQCYMTFFIISTIRFCPISQYFNVTEEKLVKL